MFSGNEDHKAKIQTYQQAIAAINNIKKPNENDAAIAARAHLRLGEIYMLNGDSVQAENNYQKTLAIFKENKNTKLMDQYGIIALICHNMLGQIYFEKQDYIAAKHYYRCASKMVETYYSKIENLPYTVKYDLITSENNLAVVYGYMKHWHRAARHFNKALHILCGNDDSSLKAKDYVRAAQLRTKLAHVYIELKNPLKALGEGVSADVLLSRIESDDEAIYRDMAICYLQLGNLTMVDCDDYALKQFDNAVALFKKGIYVHLPELIAEIIAGYKEVLARKKYNRDVDSELREVAHLHAQLGYLHVKLHHPLDRADPAESIKEYKLAIGLLHEIRKPTAEDRSAIAELHASLREIYQDNGKSMKAAGESVYSLFHRAAASFSRENGEQAKCQNKPN